ncbi:MAG: STAS domain-containing protein [Janthinobacterium lividum]
MQDGFRFRIERDDLSELIIAAKLDVTIQEVGAEIIVEAIGDVDLTTVKILEVPLTESVRATVDATKAVFLSVDLRRVDFIDSAGLALLVTARKRLALAQCSLQILLTPDKQPDRVLRLSRLDMIMALKYDNRDSAF